MLAASKPSYERRPAARNGHAAASANRPLCCASCGYEIVNYSIVPDCPMCGEFSWEPGPWRPFTRGGTAV
jgi:hypothetical protein